MRWTKGNGRGLAEPPLPPAPTVERTAEPPHGHEQRDESWETVMFSDLVWAHWLWERQRHRGETNSRAERAFRRCRGAFQQRFGEITDAYWSIRDASGVALTVARRRPGRLPYHETVPRFHLSFDWATREEPAIAEALNDCATLAIRVGEVLRGSSELIALRRIVSVASHLLGFVDRTHGRPTEADVLAVAGPSRREPAPVKLSPSDARTARRHAQLAGHFAAEERKELRRIEVFYDRAGNKQARIVYFWGMALGYLYLAPLTAATVAGIWAFDRLGDGHVHWTQIKVLVVCIAAGPLGAVLSVLTRIASSSGKFELDYEVGRKQVRWLGIFRALLGAIFGVSTYLLLASGILQTKEPSASSAFAYYGALAFLSGFFERFLKVAPGGAPAPLEPVAENDAAPPSPPAAQPLDS